MPHGRPVGPAPSPMRVRAGAACHGTKHAPLAGRHRPRRPLARKAFTTKRCARHGARVFGLADPTPAKGPPKPPTPVRPPLGGEKAPPSATKADSHHGSPGRQRIPQHAVSRAVLVDGPSESQPSPPAQRTRQSSWWRRGLRGIRNPPQAFASRGQGDPHPKPTTPRRNHHAHPEMGVGIRDIYSIMKNQA